MALVSSRFLWQQNKADDFAAAFIRPSIVLIISHMSFRMQNSSNQDDRLIGS
jgi:hypothetical protein